LGIYEIAFNPPSVIVMLVQFVLGLALGYVSVKALKYIIAFIAVLVLGVMLSIWNLGTLRKEVLESLGLTIEAIFKLLLVLMITAAGPTLIGFIVGIVISILKG
jgi:type III secretory pathway component EscS